MGFTVPNYRRAEPTEYEELYRDAFAIFDSEVRRLQNRGIAQGERGKDSLAANSYRAANIYYYLMYVLLAAYEKQKYLLAAGDTCVGKTLNEMYKFDCIEESLPCLSSTYGTDYVGAWNSMFALFGIDAVRECVSSNESCPCIGIGLMVIDSKDDCDAFIVGEGQCAVTPDDLVGEGEFASCEFPTNEIINGPTSNASCDSVVAEEDTECN
jgi:hypothetical protein